MQSKKRPRRNRHGFTLTEMLIVLGILVMLAALVVPRFLGTQKKADIQAAKTQIGLLRAALEKYALDTKDFPTTEQGLEALITPPTGEDESEVAGWDGPYLNRESLPKDPWGNDYQYAYPPERGSGDFPDIWSLGPDKEDNTEDDITSWDSSAETDELGTGGTRENLDVDVDLPEDVGATP